MKCQLHLNAVVRLNRVRRNAATMRVKIIVGAIVGSLLFFYAFRVAAQSSLNDELYLENLRNLSFRCNSHHEKIKSIEGFESWEFYQVSSVASRPGFFIPAAKSLAILNAVLELSVDITIVHSDAENLTKIFVLKGLSDEIFVGNHFPFRSIGLGESSAYVMLVTLAHEFGHILQNIYGYKNLGLGVSETQADVISGYLARRALAFGFTIDFSGWTEPVSQSEHGAPEYICGFLDDGNGDDILMIDEVDRDTNLAELNEATLDKYLKESKRIKNIAKEELLIGPQFFHACSPSPPAIDASVISHIGSVWQDHSAPEAGAIHGTYSQRISAILRGWVLGTDALTNKHLMEASLSAATEILDEK